MKAKGRDIIVGTLAAIVVGVAAFGVAMGLPGLQPPATPRPSVPEAVSVADWWVDTSAEPIEPDSEAIPALVHENACASGQDAGGRIVPPSVVYGPDTVTVTITVRRIAGVAECPGNPLTPFTIELTEPLGDRTLLDGGQIPPGDPFDDPGT